MRPHAVTRRRFLTKSGMVLGAAALGPLLPEANLSRLGRGLWLPAAYASTVLDPTNPFGNFTQDGTQSVTPGTVLTIVDQNVGDFAVLFATDFDAGAGIELDVVATFQVLATLPNNVDVGNHVVINDGQTRSAIAQCITLNGVDGIGLLSQGSPADPASYPVFVPVDWRSTPATIRLRRAANGDVELVEVNGVAPNPRALLTGDKAPGPTRPGTTVEFGCASPEARCTVEYSAFFSERPVHFIPGALNVTHFRLRDPDSTDQVRFRGDFTLSSGSNGIDPATQPVSIALSTAAGQFYPSPAADFNPLNGFITMKRRWTLNDAERVRSGIERLDIDLNSDGTGAVFLRDVRTTLPTLDYSTVGVYVLIGDDLLTGTVHLVEKPLGSGRWRFDG
jgi:hypothetical protein